MTVERNTLGRPIQGKGAVMFMPHDHLLMGRERYQDLLREAQRERLGRMATLGSRDRVGLRGTIMARLRRWAGSPPVAAEVGSTQGQTGKPPFAGDPRPDRAFASVGRAQAIG